MTVAPEAATSSVYGASSSRRLLALSCLAFGPALAPAAQGLIVAGPSGDPTADFAGFDALRRAVAAAVEGDVILARSGRYDSFVVDGKSVSLVGDEGADPVVVGILGVAIANLGGSQKVVLAGLELSFASEAFEERLLIRNCLGGVWIQDCEVVTSGGFF